MISAFGPTAERFASRLSDLELIVVEPGSIVQAYREAVRRRSRGETFYGMLIDEDRRITFVYAIAADVAEQRLGVDERQNAFNDLSTGQMPVNGRPAAEFWQDDAQTRHVIMEFYILCDAMLVRSFAEYQRLTAAFGRLARPVARILAEPEIPPVERMRPERPGVVVWGPHRAPVEFALHLVGLGQFFGEVTCVAAAEGTPPAGSDARIVTAGDPHARAALARAGCVVCIEPGDPGDAVAFARQGFGIVAPQTAGAYEFVPDAVAWDAGSAAGLHQAVAAALARPASVVDVGAPIPRAPRRPPAPIAIAELPLVTIVTPTHNRPDLLRTALQCVERQSYPRVESVVVNDAGVDVADVVAEFPFARLVRHERNRGVHAAIETGKSHARGTYLGFLPDDDGIFPDHVERILFAMLRSGAQVGHANGILRFVERAADGSLTTVGYNAATCSATTTMTDALVATPVSMNGMIYHTSVFDDVGWLINESALGDIEHQMRVASKYLYVFVDHVTWEYGEHAGNLAKSLDFATEMRRLYEEVHPVPGRPLLAALREATLARIAARVPGSAPFPPTIRF